MGEFLKAVGRHAKGILYLDPDLKGTVFTEDLGLSEKYPKFHEWGVDSEGYFYVRKKRIRSETPVNGSESEDGSVELEDMYEVFGWRPIRASRVPEKVKYALVVKDSLSKKQEV